MRARRPARAPTNIARSRRSSGPDPLPYGIAANRKTIEALEKTAFEQGLTPRRMSIDELFVDPAKVPTVA